MRNEVPGHFIIATGSRFILSMNSLIGFFMSTRPRCPSLYTSDEWALFPPREDSSKCLQWLLVWRWLLLSHVLKVCDKETKQYKPSPHVDTFCLLRRRTVPWNWFFGLSALRSSHACQWRCMDLNPGPGGYHASGQISLWATTSEPQLLKLVGLRACVQKQEKIPQWEACTPQQKKLTGSNEDPAQPKINK